MNRDAVNLEAFETATADVVGRDGAINDGIVRALCDEVDAIFQFNVFSVGSGRDVDRVPDVRLFQRACDGVGSFHDKRLRAGQRLFRQQVLERGKRRGRSDEKAQE